MLALPWKPASSPDCTQILTLLLWVNCWASKFELTLLSHMGSADKICSHPVNLDGCSPSAAPSPTMAGTDVWQGFFFAESKPMNGIDLLDLWQYIWVEGPKTALKQRTTAEAATTTFLLQISPLLYLQQRLSCWNWLFYKLALSTCYGLSGFLVLANNRKEFSHKYLLAYLALT